MGNVFASLTADQVTRGHNLEGKVAVVTGASSGIGFETARALARRGALVYLTCRDVSNGDKAKRTILEQIGERSAISLLLTYQVPLSFFRFAEKIRVCELDLSSLLSVRAFVDNFKNSGHPLHYLVLNAAVLGGPYRQTKDGFEMHFGVNYLGHFCLVQEFLPFLLQQKEHPSRIIVVNCSQPV